MSKICRTFAARKDTIMKKRTYIQPEMKVEGLSSLSSLMLPASPTGNNYNPSGAPKRLSPANPALATDTVAVF